MSINPFKKKGTKKSADPAEIEGTPEYHIRIISNSKIFPEELIEQIKEELGLKVVTRDPKENKPEATKTKKEKINFNFDMVSTSMDLKLLTEKLKKSKIKSYRKNLCKITVL